MNKREVSICIKEFEKFYELLMREAPKGYNPWFFACEPNGKNPVLGLSWHDEKARLTKEQCIEAIKQGFNLGISARKDDPLIIGDIDEEIYLEQLPKDTLTTTSRKRIGAHFFGWNKDGTAKINLPTDSGELRSDNQYVLACGSYVPFNISEKKDKESFEKLPEHIKNDNLLGYYTLKDNNIQEYYHSLYVQIVFHDKQRENIESESIVKQREETREYPEGKYSKLFKLKVSDIVGLIPAKERHGHPLHESDTDSNFSLSKDGSIAHCWRHLVSFNAVQYLCVKAGYSSCVDAGTPHKGRGISKIRGDKLALDIAYKEAINLGLIKVYTIDSKSRNEIIASLEQVGRENLPKELPSSWIQFKQTVIDIKTGEIFKAKPEYFFTSPIPWDIGESEDTPMIDKLFKEWVVKERIQDESYIRTLQEITAYSAEDSAFMQTLIWLCGSGCNGKGSYLNFIMKFLGINNICSSELKTLVTRNFETSPESCLSK